MCLHAYIIGDLTAESVLYELLRRFVDIQATGGLVHQFHNNNNYVFCTLALSALVGGYRAYALYRSKTGMMDASASSAPASMQEFAEPVSV